MGSGASQMLMRVLSGNKWWRKWYGHQQKKIDWVDALGGGVTILAVAAAYVIDPSGALSFISGMITIVGGFYDYYEDAMANVDITY